MHNLVLSVIVGAEQRLALSALELRIGHLLKLIEIYKHINIFAILH